MKDLNGSDLIISTKPVRRVIRRSSAISNGTFRTYKHPSFAVTCLPGESDNELAFLRFAEIDPAVSSILSQPTVIETTHDGKVVRHTPDFAICLSGRRTLVEVKSSRGFADFEVRRRLDAFARAARMASWDYLVVTGGELKNSPFLSSVDSLWRNHRQNFDQAQLLAVTNLLSRRARSVGEVVGILESLGPNAPEVRQILSMVASNHILIDLEPGKSVGPDSIVRARDHAIMRRTFIPFTKAPFYREAER